MLSRHTARTGRIVTLGVLTAICLSGQVAARSGADAVDLVGNPVVGAVGDMACDPSDSHFNNGAGTATACQQSRTSDAMLADTSLDAVLGLGDYQYDCGNLADYAASYTPTWGRLDNLMHPTVGNHEYKTGTDVFGAVCPSSNSTASNYFAHFGAAAHPETNGHFSFDLGTWHLIGLNANCKKVGGCTATSPETKWLQADLAATTQPCVLAFWHQPRFLGIGKGTLAGYKPWWEVLYAAHADVVLNGHIHDYQRYAAMTPDGNADPTSGITEYVVGTGGEKQVAVNSLVRPAPVTWQKTFGYLRMTLAPNSWTASFIDYNGTTLDNSTGMCHA